MRLQLGWSDEKEKKLVMMRKKYFHSILGSNQEAVSHKQQLQKMQKKESDLMASKFNHDAMESLDREVQARNMAKVRHRQALQHDYNRQISERSLRKRNDKMMDVQYLRWEQAAQDRLSERRLADLMKIYERTPARISHTRVRTEPSIPILPTPLNAEHSMPMKARLPRIQRSHTLEHMPRLG